MMKRSSGGSVRVLVLVVARLAGMTPLPSRALGSTDADAGRALFMQKGCYECHGTAGKGSISTGPALAPHPIPLAAMQAYVHQPKGDMPVYSEKTLSNADIALIHAYLASLPSASAAANISLLNDGSPGGAAPLASTHGSQIYEAVCAGCHGSRGEGAVGPSLTGIGGKHSLEDIEGRIREPVAAMPRLYPAVLNAQDVEEIARYVQSLK